MRKNFNKQYGKRPWKTPSPSSNNDIKSPRYNTNRPALLCLESKTLKQDIQKNKPMLLTFKNQLVELKQEANKIPTTPVISLDTLVHREYMDDENEIKKNQQVDSYNSYFSRVSSVYSNLVKNTHNQSKNSKFVRGSGFKTEELETTAPLSQQNSKYEEKLKKYVENISKLKDNYKKLQENYQKTCEYVKRVQNQLETSKSQIGVLKKKVQQKKYRQGTLNQQIKNLKQLLEINTNQLNTSNFEIYKMKQQIYELSLQKQKMEHRFHTDKPKPSRSEIKHQYELLPCLMCKTNQKLILSLNNAIENKMLEINKKDNMIQTLCTDLQKLEVQSKMFEKPKFVIRKISAILQNANQLLMVNKLKELNNKFKKQSSQLHANG